MSDSQEPKPSKRKKNPKRSNRSRDAASPSDNNAVLYLQLAPGDFGWGLGCRYRVDQIDGDQHFFMDRERAEAFIVREGLRVVSFDEMMRYRGEV